MVNVSRYTGCLIGGALGDALGYPIEIMSYEQILASYGVDGMVQPQLNKEGVAEISDDTQMTLFTAEGLLWAKSIENKRGNSDVASRCFYSYERWLHTQDYPLADKNYEWILDDERLEINSPLLKTKELYARRSPSTTCLEALMKAKNQDFGRQEQPINDSKSSSAIMCIAPIGLMYYQNPKRAFEMGCNVAAITHTHPTAFYSSGALCTIIAYILNGRTIKEAAAESVAMLVQCPGAEETRTAIERALFMAEEGQPDIAKIASLGEGFVAEEALAIGLYVALCCENDFKRGILLSVNHSGDSDTTGTVCGNILGAALGIDGIEDEWIQKLECKDVIIEMAYQLFCGGKDASFGFDQAQIQC